MRRAKTRKTSTDAQDGGRGLAGLKATAQPLRYAPMRSPLTRRRRRPVARLIALTLGMLLAAPLARSQPDLAAELARADAWEDGNQTERAAELLEGLDRANPDQPAILWRLSQVYSDLTDETSDNRKKRAYAKSALTFAQRAVAKAPNEARARIALSIAYGKMADFVDNRTKIEYSRYVKAEAERCVQLDPKIADAYEVLARWHYEMATLNPVLAGIAQTLYGRLPPASKDAAFDYFRKAIAVAPDRIGYHAEYAKALDESGRRAEAKAEWARVLALPAEDAEDRAYQREAAGKVR